MTDLPADLASRVARLIPRLASEHQGEVAATAAALTRTLKAGGRDWHDLAQRVAEGPRTVIQFIERSPREAPAYPFAAWRDAARPQTTNEAHRTRVARCQRAPGARSAWEISFLDSIAQRLRLGRRLTENQAASLDGIAERLGVL